MRGEIALMPRKNIMSREFKFELQKLKSDYPEFFKQFSPELLEFIFSEKTSRKIAEICTESGVEDEEKVEKIAYRVTLILFNQIPKKNLTTVLINGVGLNFDIASQISQKVNELIFSQFPKIKLLEEVQKEKEKLTIGEFLGLTGFIKKEERVSRQKTEKPLKKDIYRESTE